MMINKILISFVFLLLTVFPFNKNRFAIAAKDTYRIIILYGLLTAGAILTLFAFFTTKAKNERRRALGSTHRFSYVTPVLAVLFLAPAGYYRPMEII